MKTASSVSFEQMQLREPHQVPEPADTVGPLCSQEEGLGQALPSDNSHPLPREK